MPYTTLVSKDARIGLIRMSGSVDGPEIMAAAAEIADNPDWQINFRPVWDMRRISALDVLPDHMTRIMTQEATLTEGDVAGASYVITHDDVTYGLVLIIRSHLAKSGRTVTPVRTVAEAETLLGVALPRD